MSDWWRTSSRAVRRTPGHNDETPHVIPGHKRAARQLADSEDPDVATAVFELFGDEGIDVHLQTQVPFCMFLDPELARVGYNETQARRHGTGYRLLTLPMAAVLRTRTLSEPRGFLKMLIIATPATPGRPGRAELSERGVHARQWQRRERAEPATPGLC